MNGEEVIEKLLVDINEISNERIRNIKLHLSLLLLSIIIYILVGYFNIFNMYIATSVFLVLYTIFIKLMMKNGKPIWDKGKCELKKYIKGNIRGYSEIQLLLDYKIIELENKKLKIPFKDIAIIITSATISGLYFKESRDIAIYSFFFCMVAGYFIYIFSDSFFTYFKEIEHLKQLKEIFFEIDIKNRNYSKKIGHKNFIRKARNRRNWN